MGTNSSSTNSATQDLALAVQGNGGVTAGGVEERAAAAVAALNGSDEAGDVATEDRSTAVTTIQEFICWYISEEQK